MKKIFFIGGTGLLALNWAAYCYGKFKVILGTNKKLIKPSFASTISLSGIQSGSSLQSIIGKIEPDIVINTAAITNIEYCEMYPENAYESNVNLASQVAIACNKLDIPLVHVSTDHLFSGLDAYSAEEKQPSPINVYSKTKAIAEEQVGSECSNSIIVRTNFFGIGTSYRRSFTDQIISELAKNDSFWGFDDVFFTPILASDLAECVHQLIENKRYGVYNVSSNNRISKFEFALLVARLFGYSESLVKPCKIEERSNLVNRPRDMSLSNCKVSATLKRDLGTAEDGLRRLRDQFNQKIYQGIQAL